MLKKLFSVCAIFLAAASHLTAAEVLLKPIGQELTNYQFYSEMDKVLGGWPAFTGPMPQDDIVTGTNTFDLSRPRSRAPGFRTAASAEFVYAVGLASVQRETNQDSFLSQMHPSGSVRWTKLFSSIMASTGRFGWLPMDIEVLGDRLYVCGMTTTMNNAGFVAKLTLEGNLEDYTLFESDDLVRTTSLALGSIGGVPCIVVAGDARGSSFKIKERQLTAPLNVYDELVLGKNGTIALRDAFVVRLDANLKAKWGTTMGFKNGDDYATAVTTDNSGNIYLALGFHPNADTGNQSRIHHVDGQEGFVRKVYSENNLADLTELSDAHNAGVDIHYDTHPGYWGMLLKIDSGSGLSARIKQIFQPCRVDSVTSGSSNHISDLSYYDGSLYVAGGWRGSLRPIYERTEAAFLLSSQSTGYDAFVTRLNADTLNADAWRFFQSSGEDFIHELTVDTSGIYIGGTAGGSMDTFKNYGADSIVPPNSLATINRTDPNAQLLSLGGSSSSHLFWQKMSIGNLNTDAASHIKPVEGGTDSVPPGQRNAGIAVLGQTIVIVGGHESGTVTYGPPGETKKLPSGVTAYAGYVKTSDFSFQKEIPVTITSPYGNPLPHKGRGTVATGVTVEASVPQTIYEAAGGVILDSQNSEAISKLAVTRRVCIGYQFNKSQLNGTVNKVTFVANEDAELTFLWRTEHAVEVESDLATSDGLTSPAAGNPTPSVQKHWFRENEPFSAFVDGEVVHAAQNGVRWRSKGFVAEGCIATAINLNSGSTYNWPSFQSRQQTARVTVGSPGRIVWKWAKEHSLRVATNSIVATDSPITTGNIAPTPLNSAIIAGLNVPFWTFAQPVEITGIRIRTKATFNATTTVGLVLNYQNGERAHLQSTAGYQPSATYTFTRPATGRKDTSFFLWGFTGTTFSDPNLEAVELLTSTDVVTLTGSGERWFPAGATVTATAPASVTSGTSVLQLKGYTNGTGSVLPFASPGTLTKTLVLDKPSAITWDYARAIYKENVTVGETISYATVTGIDFTNLNENKAPLGGTVSVGPVGSGWNDMLVWDEVAKVVHVLRPGKFTVEFENRAAPTDQTQNVIVEVTAT